MSWTQTSESSEYREAVQAVESLDPPAAGFVKATEVRGGPTSLQQTIIKQNNLLIQLLVKVSEQLNDAVDSLRQLSTATRGKEKASTDFDAVISDLTKRLEKVSLGGSDAPTKKLTKGPYYVFEDPYKIFDKEKKRQ